MTGTADAKRALRRALLARRRSAEPPAGDADLLAARVLTLPALAAPGPVALYVSLPGEPPTAALLEALRAAGREVLLPVLLDDGDLDWAAASGSTVAGRLGLAEPDGARLGTAAVAAAVLVVVPALACDRAGRRLGRGGGSYDRALARVPATTTVVALVRDAELLDAVPVEPHDRPVDVVVTPTRIWTVPGS